MIGTRREIARERRRQIQVRKSFEAALMLDEGQRTGLSGFYTACGVYLVYSLDRLHDQDQIIHDLLAQRIPAGDTQAHRGLAELNGRQEKTRGVVAAFGKAVEALKKAGEKGRQTFEQAGTRFIDACNTLMAPRRNPFFRYTDSLFSEADWVRIAAVSDESRALEAELFARVRQHAPQGIDPEQYTVQHRPGE